MASDLPVAQPDTVTASDSDSPDSPVEKRYVLVLYTGGTIGMVDDGSGG